MAWVVLFGLSVLLTIVIVAVACSRFTRRTEDQYVERFRSARPHNGNE